MKVHIRLWLGLALVVGLCAEATAEVQLYQGREMERVACTLASPEACVAGGGRRVDKVGVWNGSQLHWHDTGVATPADARSGVYIGVSRFMRSHVLRQMNPANQVGGTSDGAHTGAFRADVFYNTWDDAGLGKGTTIGANPTMIIGEDVELAIRVPLYVTDIDAFDLLLYHYGVDLSLAAHVSEQITLGVHGSYSRDHVEDADFSDDEGYLNGGPFASLLIPLGGASLSLGGLFEYGIPEESEAGDETMLLVGAANLGLPLGDTMAANIFGMYYYHLDSALSDYNYIDAGGELALALGETWAVQLGGRIVIGLDYLDSMEIYAGSEWRF
ncbi:MAG: hypothetical protein HQ523_09550 [Lentisphaerae bacterium]|nr:hypothetical protein [Lentisphaerota bacterium]